MPEYIDVKRKTMSAYVMHCQKEPCKKIIQKGDDYLFGLKENQKSLFEDVALFFSVDVASVNTYLLYDHHNTN